MGLINCIESGPESTITRLNIAYGWLKEEREHEEKIYKTSEVLELVKALLGEEN